MNLINLRNLGLPALPGFLASPGLLDGNDAQAAAGAAGTTSAPSAPVSGTGGFSRIYAFGDSLSDAGNIYNLSLRSLPAAPYAKGEFSNGPVWVQQLAVRLGLPPPAPSTLGGTDFAYGGTKTGAEARGLNALNPLDLPSQFVQFAAGHRSPEPQALYTISIGGNDVLSAATSYPTDPAGAVAAVDRAVAAETRFVQALAAGGARNLLVLNVPDVGKTPAVMAKGAQAAAVGSSLAAQYNARLATSLSSLAAREHLNLHLVDTYSLLGRGVADPAAFGLTEVKTPIWTGNYLDPRSGALNATGAAQSGYLFFDGIHPSATGHGFLAASAHQSLTIGA